MGLWIRARANSLNKNAQPDDIRASLDDLSKLDNQNDKRIIKESRRLINILTINETSNFSNS
jgi:hypothetical protein